GLAETLPQTQPDVSELHRHDLPCQQHPKRRAPDHRAAADGIIEHARVIASHASPISSVNPTMTPNRRNRSSNASRLTTVNPTSKQISTKLRTAPVHHFDDGANVSRKTAITLMTIVAITTHNRPRSSAGSCVFARDMTP